MGKVKPGELEKWTISLYGNFCKQEILKKYAPDKVNTLASIDFTLYYDNRRKNTIYSALYSCKAIDNLQVQPTHINEKTFKVNAPILAKAPTFTVSGVHTEKYYHGDRKKEAYKTRYQAYKSYGKFSREEWIYIYLHQRKYDFHLYEKEIKSTKWGNSSPEIRTYLQIYEKSLIKKLDDKIFDAKIEDYIRGHICESLNKTFDLNIKRLYETDSRWDLDGDSFLSCISGLKETNWTEEEITKRLAAVAKGIRLHRRACKDLIALRQVIRKAGGWEKFRKKMVKNYKEYLAQKAPLYINTDDGDLKPLVEKTLRGDKAFL